MGHIRRWLLGGPTKPNLFNKLTLTVYILSQLADGILTYIGVSTLGMEAEGNPLLVLIMSLVGVGFGLVVAKFAGLILGIILYRYGFHKLVVGLTIFYVVVAIIPWMHIFMTF